MIRKSSLNLTLYLTLLLLFSCTAGKNETAANSLHDGDIIFHETVSSQGTELKLATGSRYTHMGIIFKKDGRLFVLEAISPVSVTPIGRFISRGREKHYVVKRLKNADTILTPVILERMKSAGRQMTGKKYDTLFQWTDERIYCSELVWKIYKRAAGIEIGRLQKYRDFNLTHPKVKELLKKRFGSREIPLDETVISPVEMFNSPLLETVEEKN